MWPLASAVAESRGSMPAMAVSMMAASVTERHMGPAVSWLCAIGMMPARLTSPTVGLIPTRPQALDGLITDPSVSVPTPAAAKLPLTAEPVPELEPLGFRSSTNGFLHCRPRPDQNPKIGRAHV